MERSFRLERPPFPKVDVLCGRGGRTISYRMDEFLINTALVLLTAIW
jgi:hypothetical protein